MIKLIDTHAHLDQIDDIENNLMRAKNAYVGSIIGVGTGLASDLKLLEIAKSNSGVKIQIALGIHPTEIEDSQVQSALSLIDKHIGDIVAIGEAGLDYWRKDVKKDKSRRLRQQDVFRLQLKLAERNNLPVIIHSRGAWEDCLKLCLEENIKKAVFHWYSGPINILKDIINEGYFISATPSLAYSQQHQDAIKATDLEKLLIETDSPVFFGKPEEGGFRVEPKDVRKTGELVSKLINIPLEEVIYRTNKNAEQLFSISI